MTTIPEVVEDIIRKSPFLEEALADGLINVSSLARKIRSEISERLKKDVKEGAVIMAINRMAPSNYYKINLKIQNFMHSIGDVIVRSNLSDFTFTNSETLYVATADLLKEAGQHKELFCTFSAGVYETTVIVSDSLKDVVNRSFHKEKQISFSENLASITIKLPTENTEISGIYYYILKRIAWEGINIREVISTSNEFTLVVNDVDIDRTFSILMSLKKM
ncbi:MAG TPA: aspartate kinase [Flavobacteriales bacterium]|nr:aspartate kinase [Flavobacteriales bacterium]HRE96218.1 aspartate kinase [Flavobacteriales bacterium]HRJ36007.1 aspartate kinase [Flavobacteriales bacterium]HRJ38413.1 aspartate kinase [Flavobacteriales bacterium]